MKNSFMSGLESLAQDDESIFLCVGDLGYGVVDSFAERFPERYINAGISEQNMSSVAAGLALEGYTVYMYSIGNFPTLRCLEQIRNDICYHEANVKIMVAGGGFAYGQLGMSHHATEDLAELRALPGMRVFSPADPMEAVAVLKEVNRIKGPCYVRLGRGREEDLHPNIPVENVYQAVCMAKGYSVNLFATGPILKEAIHAAALLSEKGISVGVYSFIAVKPIDVETIYKCAHNSALIVTLEEHNRIGGFGSAVAEIISEFPGVHAPLLRLGLDDIYTSTVGSQSYLRYRYQLDGESVAEKIAVSLECMKQ